MNCPNCNSRRSTLVTGFAAVYECRKCGAVYGRCYKGDSYNLVLPYFVTVEPPMEETRYYDLEVLGSTGVERRHGWYQPSSKRIVQVG